MRYHLHGRRRGFTLIELLVVVAIIGLLISILLPSLREAREQARIAKCMSGLRSIGLAANSYLLDGQTGLPFALPNNYNGNPNFSYYTEFIWGGGMPGKTAGDWNAGLANANGGTASNFANMDTYVIRPRERPMNRYIATEVTWDRDRTRRVGGYDAQSIPDFFRCPSDITALVPSVGAANPQPDAEQIWEMWDFWGSSYPINWYWPYYYMPVLNVGFISAIGAQQNQPGLGATLVRDKTGGAASEFLLFMEGQFNYALANARPPGHTGGGPWGSSRPLQVTGWHKKLNKHVGAFMDGSARYETFDTRFLLGSNWTIWPNKPWRGTWAQYNDKAPIDENALP